MAAPRKTSARKRAARRQKAVQEPAGRSLADPLNRAVALALDILVIALIGIVVAATLGQALGGVVTDPTLVTSGGDLSAGPFILVAIAVLALSLAYFALGWTRWLATPGMRLLGLAILDDGGWDPLPARHAVMRCDCCCISPSIGAHAGCSSASSMSR